MLRQQRENSAQKECDNGTRNLEEQQKELYLKMMNCYERDTGARYARFMYLFATSSLFSHFSII